MLAPESRIDSNLNFRELMRRTSDQAGPRATKGSVLSSGDLIEAEMPARHHRRDSAWRKKSRNSRPSLARVTNVQFFDSCEM